jgi:putative hydrolase of the HAD superfamily
MAPEEVVARVWQDRTYQELERGEITIDEYRARLAGLLGAPDFSTEQFLSGWNGVFFGLVKGAIELLDALSGRGLRLAALTNTNVAHTEVWMGLYPEIVRRFERIFLSCELGSRKPEPQAYRAVLEYLALAPDRTVFVDDREENVAAARDLGMKGLVAENMGSIVEALRDLGLADLAIEH